MIHSARQLLPLYPRLNAQWRIVGQQPSTAAYQHNSEPRRFNMIQATIERPTRSDGDDTTLRGRQHLPHQRYDDISLTEAGRNT